MSIFDKEYNRYNTNSLKYDFAQARKRPKDILPLWVADMDFPAPKEVLDVLVEKSKYGIFGYSEPTDEYFDAIHNWFLKRHNWDADPNKFLLAFGVIFAIGAAIRALTEEKDSVLICQPVYYPFEKIILDNNRKLVISNLQYKNDLYQFDFKDFEEKIIENDVKVFILCSPHNPVGRVWKVSELQKIDEICQKHNVFIISDEIHADFTFEGYTHNVFAKITKNENNYIVCTAPTKTFNLAGLHNSNIYVPSNSIRNKMIQEFNRVGFSQSNLMGIIACQSAYNYGEGWYLELKEYLKKNLDFVREYLKKNLPQIKLIEPQGTYLVWLDFRALNMTNKELSNLLIHKANVWLDDGYIFGNSGSGFERINIACHINTLKKALDSIYQAINNR